MTNKEIQKLSRKELLEILIKQSSEIERLQTALAEAEAKLSDREIKISKAGSIAEAALALNGMFEAAEASISQYTENIRKTDEKCLAIQKEAEQRARLIIAAAKSKAEGIESEAKTNAEKYWEEASCRLESFYNEHEGLRELIQMKHPGRKH